MKPILALLALASCILVLPSCASVQSALSGKEITGTYEDGKVTGGIKFPK